MTKLENETVSKELKANIENEILPLADELEEVFKRVSKTIEEEMARAAKSGAVSFKSMVEEIINDLARLAIEEYIKTPLEEAILKSLGGASGGRGTPTDQLASQISEIFRQRG